jgi:hypothetical protein
VTNPRSLDLYITIIIIITVVMFTYVIFLCTYPHYPPCDNYCCCCCGSVLQTFTSQLHYQDRNFRGMGETLDVSLTRTETSPANFDILHPPKFLMKWVDSAIGKLSRVSVGGETDTASWSLASVVPAWAGKTDANTGGLQRLFRSSHVYLNAEK